MWEHPVYPIIFLAEMPFFNVILEVGEKILTVTGFKLYTSGFVILL